MKYLDGGWCREAGVGQAQHTRRDRYARKWLLWERAEARDKCLDCCSLYMSLRGGFGCGSGWDVERLNHRPFDQTRQLAPKKRGLVRVGLCICPVYSLVYEERDS